MTHRKRSKRSLESQEDEVRLWNGRPIKSLHMRDLRLELKYYKLPTKGNRHESVERLSNHVKNLLTFQTLPDEIVLKILKMTLSSDQDHDNIVKISKLSSKFNRIARDTSLWRGAVGLTLNRVDGKTWEDKNFLGEGVTNLTLSDYNGYFDLYKEDLDTMAEECPKLVSLTLRNIAVRSWSSLYFGVKDLRICNPYPIQEMFEGVKLDMIFPQIESFRFDVGKNTSSQPSFRQTIWLPDMTECQNLQKVCIRMVVNAGPPQHAFRFKIPSELEETGPFPKGLKILEIHGSIYNFTREEIRAKKGPDCKVSLQGPVTEHSNRVRDTDWYSKSLWM